MEALGEFEAAHIEELIIRDGDLRDIKDLTSLELLVLDRSYWLSSECFTFVAAVASLRTLVFTTDISEDEKDTFDKQQSMKRCVSLLGDMESLCSITLVKENPETCYRSSYSSHSRVADTTLFVLIFARTKYCAILRTGTKLRSV